MIRHMHAADRDAVIAILKSTKMFTHLELTIAVEQIDIYLNNSNQKDYTVVVVESEGFQVLGYMSFGPAPIAEDVYNLYWIAIHPHSQGKGYGRELLLWLEKHVQSTSARMIIAETSSLALYKPTREFYRAMGFEAVSRVPDFYKPGDDLITYVKHMRKPELKKYGSMVGHSKAAS